MSEFQEHPSISNAEEGSPEQLAAQIFSSSPKDPCSICILPYSNTIDNDALTFNFEILLTIYLEGFMNILDVIKYKHLQDNPKDSERKSYELENDIYNRVTLEDLKFPEPWFRSFGYTIQIDEFRGIDRSYCRILLSFDPKDRINFLMKDLKQRYHFVLNKKYRKVSDMENIYTVLVKDKKYFRISFRIYKA